MFCYNTTLPGDFVSQGVSDTASERASEFGSPKPMAWSGDFYLPLWKDAVARAGLSPDLRFHDSGTPARAC